MKNASHTTALDETIYSATEAAERIRRVLAYIHSDLTGSTYPEENEVVPSAGILDAACRLRDRLQGIADALPQLRGVITAPAPTAINQAQNAQNFANGYADTAASLGVASPLGNRY